MSSAPLVRDAVTLPLGLGIAAVRTAPQLGVLADPGRPAGREAGAASEPVRGERIDGLVAPASCTCWARPTCTDVVITTPGRAHLRRCCSSAPVKPVCSVGVRAGRLPVSRRRQLGP